MSCLVTCFSFKPPYHASIAMKPYPAEYTVPNFQRFAGQKGNTIEHVSQFVDAMGMFAYNSELCLMEFSKSLSDRTYIWYLNLKPGLIQDWDYLVTLFNAKFFCDETKFTLTKLG